MYSVHRYAVVHSVLFWYIYVYVILCFYNTTRVVVRLQITNYVSISLYPSVHIVKSSKLFIIFQSEKAHRQNDETFIDHQSRPILLLC